MPLQFPQGGKGAKFLLKCYATSTVKSCENTLRPSKGLGNLQGLDYFRCD